MPNELNLLEVYDILQRQGESDLRALLNARRLEFDRQEAERRAAQRQKLLGIQTRQLGLQEAQEQRATSPLDAALREAAAQFVSPESLEGTTFEEGLPLAQQFSALQRAQQARQEAERYNAPVPSALGELAPSLSGLVQEASLGELSALTPLLSVLFRGGAGGLGGEGVGPTEQDDLIANTFQSYLPKSLDDLLLTSPEGSQLLLELESGAIDPSSPETQQRLSDLLQQQRRVALGSTIERFAPDFGPEGASGVINSLYRSQILKDPEALEAISLYGLSQAQPEGGGQPGAEGAPQGPTGPPRPPSSEGERILQEAQAAKAASQRQAAEEQMTSAYNTQLGRLIGREIPAEDIFRGRTPAPFTEEQLAELIPRAQALLEGVVTNPYYSPDPSLVPGFQETFVNPFSTAMAESLFTDPQGYFGRQQQKRFRELRRGFEQRAYRREGLGGQE